MTARPTSGRVPALDGVRGLAIVSVLAWHYVAVPAPWDRPWSLHVHTALAFAWAGVDLFFVLSGFLIGGIVLDHHRAPNFLRVFYGRRALRILPLYWTVLLAFAVSRAFLGPHLPGEASALLHANAHSMPTYLGFAQNVVTALLTPNVAEPSWVNVTWSLAVEEHFYLVVPILLATLPGIFVPWVLSGVVLAGPAIRALLLAHLPSDGGIYIVTPARIDTLMLGVLCAWAMRRPRFRAALRRGPLYAVVALLGIAIAASQLVDVGRVFPIAGYSAFAVLCAAVLLLACVEDRGVVAAVVRSRALQRCGLLAYGLYLFHQPVNGLVHAAVLGAVPTLGTVSGAAATVLSLVVTFVLAEISWRFLEQPLMAIGQRLRYARAPIPAPQNADREERRAA